MPYGTILDSGYFVTPNPALPITLSFIEGASWLQVKIGRAHV